MNNLYMLLAVAVGAGLAVQAAVNTQLRAATGSALWAAIISSAFTVIVLASAELFVRDTLRVAGISRYPWWIWLGGVMGATYVFAIVALTRYLGVALIFAAVIVGQLVTGLLIDHYGWFYLPSQRLSVTRILGAALLVAGLVLIRWR